MLRRELLRVLLATVPGRWLGRAGVIAGLSDEPVRETNAAVLYERAFTMAEELRSGESGDLVRDRSVSIHDPRLTELIGKVRPALDAVREAAGVDRCAWSREILVTDDLDRGRLDRVYRRLIRLLCVSAELSAERGKGRQALDDLFAGLALAHRVGTGGVYIARLFESADRTVVFQSMGRILPRLDAGVLKDLSGRLEALPAPEPASAVIGPESRFVVGHLRDKLSRMGDVLGEKDWSELGCRPEEAETYQRLTKGERGAMRAHLEATGPAFAELARRLDLPRPQCLTALAEFEKTERFTFPAAAGLVECGIGVLRAVDYMSVLLSMALAGVVLVREGESGFRRILGPFGVGSFGLERRGEGWVIKSALKDEGRPDVVFVIGATG